MSAPPGSVDTRRMPMHRPILVVLDMVLGGHAVVKWEVGKCRKLSVKARSAGITLGALVEMRGG